jgi:hypothetical protein
MKAKYTLTILLATLCMLFGNNIFAQNRVVSGRLYIDNNNNCQFDNGDNVMVGAQVKLNYLDTTNEVFTLTDSSGNYSFTIPSNKQNCTVYTSLNYVTCIVNGSYDISSFPTLNADFPCKKNSSIVIGQSSSDCNPVKRISLNADLSGYNKVDSIRVKINFGNGSDTIINIKGNYDSQLLTNSFLYSFNYSHYTPGLYHLFANFTSPDSINTTDSITRLSTLPCKTISGRIYVDSNRTCNYEPQYDKGVKYDINVASHSYSIYYDATTNISNPIYKPNGEFSIEVPDNGEPYKISVERSYIIFDTLSNDNFTCPGLQTQTINTLPANNINFPLKSRDINIKFDAGIESSIMFSNNCHYLNSYYYPTCVKGSAASFYGIKFSSPGYANKDLMTIKAIFGDGTDSTVVTTIDSVNYVFNKCDGFQHKFYKVGTFNPKFLIETSDGNKDSITSIRQISILDCAEFSGRVYVDMNNNCKIDSTDKNGFFGVKLIDSAGNDLHLTGITSSYFNDGKYTLYAPDKTQSYSVVFIDTINFHLNCLKKY